MQLDGRNLEGDELEMHVACAAIPDRQTKETLQLMARYVSRLVHPAPPAAEAPTEPAPAE